MKRSLHTVSKVLAGGVAIAALGVGAIVGGVGGVCLFEGTAEAQYAPPPPEVIATLTPVYHEGHAAYWYNGFWHYRQNNAWAYYHAEPEFLRTYRVAHPAYYHHYR